ncbi:MAG: hypothetical protein NVS3B7_06570 [Candidatus Elarobacter sp.]
MLSAPEAFMAVANATAAIVVKAPPYVTYRVHGVAHVMNGDGTNERTVTVRTSDGDAVVHDETTSKDVLRPPFPAPPNFDALSKFKLRGEISVGTQKGHKGLARDGDMRVENIEPLRYAPVATRADTVARAVRGYLVTYAADTEASTGHLHLEPTPEQRATKKWLRDLWYDPATMLPTRVVYGGENDFSLDARYVTVNGVWLLHAIQVGAIFHAPFWLGRMTVSLSGTYDDYRFSETAPDPRLEPSPAPATAAPATGAPAAGAPPVPGPRGAATPAPPDRTVKQERGGVP